MFYLRSRGIPVDEAKVAADRRLCRRSDRRGRGDEIRDGLTGLCGARARPAKERCNDGRAWTQWSASTARSMSTRTADFPILSREVYGKPLVYLDNAASAQKPSVVIDAMREAYEMEYANVHRGLHYLSNTATGKFEDAREKVRRFLNAPTADRSFSPGTRPMRSTSWRQAGAWTIFPRVTKSSFPFSSTTPTSYHGIFIANAREPS